MKFLISYKLRQMRDWSYILFLWLHFPAVSCFRITIKFLMIIVFLLGSFFGSFHLLNSHSATHQCWRLYFHWGITSEYVAFVPFMTCKLPNFVTILIFCCLILFLIFHFIFLLMACISYFNMDFLNSKGFK